jgi:hypothetical protein
MKRRKTLAARDQAVSEFSGTLMRLCDATASIGAALVDAEGETVDYAGCLDPFEIRVLAAEWRLVLQCANASTRVTGEVGSLYYRGRKKSFAVYAIADGYALVIQIADRSLLPSTRAVAEAVRSLATEAGLQLDESSEFRSERWHRVDVRLDEHKRRPTDFWHAGEWVSFQVLGRYVEAESNTRCVGYRAQLRDGTELTLIREPLGIWYADELPLRDLTNSGLPNSRV